MAQAKQVEGTSSGRVSARCREDMHLWCPLKAGRYGKYPCSCPCHEGQVSKARR
jgi:hypothetical protein